MMVNFIFILIILLLFCLCCIIFVAFFTLFERIILASTQIRKGPNTVGILGLGQPFSDAIKLLFKELVIPYKINLFIFILSPLFMLFLSLFLWFLLPISSNSFIILYDFVFLLVFLFSSLNALNIILIGWSSNSKYSFQGALRCVSQIISYELPFGIILLDMILIYSSLNILQVVLLQDNSFGIWNWLTFILFLISCLGETNRTPFDLSEAESELVSGYHTEHSALLFTYIFLAEYSFIIITSHLIVVLFLGGWLPFLIFNIEWFSYSIKLILVLFLFILIRATLPRYRYDQLMYLGWLVLLPLSFSCLFFDIFYLCIVNKFSTIYIYW